MTSRHPQARVEAAAAAALDEVRKVVGALREDAHPTFAPQRGLADIAGILDGSQPGPKLDVALSGELPR